MTGTSLWTNYYRAFRYEDMAAWNVVSFYTAVYSHLPDFTNYKQRVIPFRSFICIAIGFIAYWGMAFPPATYYSVVHWLW